MKLLVSPQTIIQTSVFSVPFFLLWTPNFSVGFVAIIALYSICYCINNFRTMQFDTTDWIVLAIFSIYLLVNLPNVITDGGKFRYIDGPSRIFLCFPIYLMLKQEIHKVKIRKAIEIGVFGGAVGAFGIAIYQYFIVGLPRVDGFLFSINFGYLACSLAFLNISLIKDSQRKSLLLIGFILAVIATTLTLTRGAIVAIPVLLILVFIINKNHIKKKQAFIFTASFIALIFSSYLFSPSIQGRVSYTINEANLILSGKVQESASSGGRLQLWSAALEALKISPLKGLTYQQREILNKELFKQGKINEWAGNLGRGHAHSQYFEMLASNGIPSIFAIALMFAAPIVIFLRNLNNIYSSAGLVFISGIIIFGFTEVLLQANLISTYFGFFLAVFLSSSLKTIDRKSEI